MEREIGMIPPFYYPQKSDLPSSSREEGNDSGHLWERLFTLMENELWQKAESYLLEHQEELPLPDVRTEKRVHSLARELEVRERRAGAVLCYRILIETILTQRRTRSYGMGVRYLQQAEVLAHRIESLSGVVPHGQYRRSLKERHRFKYTFWKKVEENR